MLRTVLLSAVALMTPLLAAEAPRRPAFSWDQVPTWSIVRKQTAYTAAEIAHLATSPLVVFEKANGYQDAGCVEDGVRAAARAVKAVHPGTVTLFYWNAVIAYGNYRAEAEFERNLGTWALHREGAPVRFKNRYYLYDQTAPGFPAWWIGTATGMAADPAIDGVFIDAICKLTTPDDGPGTIYPDRRYGDAYVAMATRLKRDLGSDLLIGNALRVAAPGANLHHLDYLDGSYVERWAIPPRGVRFADYVAQGMQAMGTALAQGKLILFRAGLDCLPAAEADGFARATDREAWMREHLPFPLAVFLMVAEPGAYFHWGSGPSVNPGAAQDVWRQDLYPDLQRPLGTPRGPATVHGTTYRREFAHLIVELDLERRTSRFTWR